MGIPNANVTAEINNIIIKVLFMQVKMLIKIVLILEGRKRKDAAI